MKSEEVDHSRPAGSYINNSEHIWECHVCADEENCPVDVHHTLLVQILPIVDYAKDRSNNLEPKKLHNGRKGSKNKESEAYQGLNKLDMND